MIDNPWFYVAAVLAVLLTGISKGGFSGGIGLVAVPAMALVLLPLAPIGMALGIWAHKTVPEEPFFRIIYALIFVVGLKLIWDGLRFVLGG